MLVEENQNIEWKESWHNILNGYAVMQTLMVENFI